jgi:hypothetical protein
MPQPSQEQLEALKDQYASPERTNNKFRTLSKTQKVAQHISRILQNSANTVALLNNSELQFVSDDKIQFFRWLETLSDFIIQQTQTELKRCLEFLYQFDSQKWILYGDDVRNFSDELTQRKFQKKPVEFILGLSESKRAVLDKDTWLETSKKVYDREKVLLGIYGVNIFDILRVSKVNI